MHWLSVALLVLFLLTYAERNGGGLHPVRDGGWDYYTLSRMRVVFYTKSKTNVEHAPPC